MTIVFLVHDIHFGGGGERVTINLANYFVEKVSRVLIVSLSPPKATNLFTIDKRIRIEYLGINFNIGSNLINKLSSVFKVIKHFNNYKGQTIILGIGNYPSLLLCFIFKRKNFKTVGCQHLAYSGIKNTWALLRTILFRRLDRVVSLTFRDLSKYTKLNKNSILIPNSISLIPKQPSMLTHKRILFIGRMVYEKGYDLLLEVIKRISIAHPDWDFRIIGDGPLKNQVLKQIEISAAKEKISWIPSTKLIEDEYLNASIFLMTSRTEGLPMVLLEAQACGLPIVSFDCETGPSDIVIDNQNGFLINCYDIDKMVECISLLCSNDNLRIEFGQNALENIQKFRPEAINSTWESLFTELFQH